MHTRAQCATVIYMTKMLEEAIKKLRELPEVEQDEAAAMLLSVTSKNEALVELDDNTRAAIRVGREQARRGEFVSEKDMAEFFRRHRVKRYGA
jgi:predicted transcriptional regulator